MKMGDMVFYIVANKLHYGMILRNERGVLSIREKVKITRKVASQVAWEVSDECRRFGLESYGKICDRQGVARCTGKKR